MMIVNLVDELVIGDMVLISNVFDDFCVCFGKLFIFDIGEVIILFVIVLGFKFKLGDCLCWVFL